MKIHDEQRRSHRRQWARVSVAACILLTFVCLGLWKILDTRRVETLTACTKKMEMQHIIVHEGEKMTIMRLLQYAKEMKLKMPLLHRCF